jgi:hypothetical protein
MKTDINILIQSQINETEKKFLTNEITEQIVFLYYEIASDYERNVFEKVHHVDLFFQNGFDSYIDSKEVCNQIINELKKDSISIREDHILKIISIIRANPIE